MTPRTHRRLPHRLLASPLLAMALALPMMPAGAQTPATVTSPASTSAKPATQSAVQGVQPASAEQVVPPPVAAPVPAAKPAAVKGVPGQASSGDESLDNSVAAVLVTALSEQLATPAISLKLDSIDARAAGPRDKSVSGLGRVRMADDDDWIGFRFRTVYDTLFLSAGDPELIIGGVTESERESPNDAMLMIQLENRVATDLDREYGEGVSRLQFERIRTVEAGTRLLRISAAGTADLGAAGEMPLQIESLYDIKRDTWLRVDYTLGQGGVPVVLPAMLPKP